MVPGMVLISLSGQSNCIMISGEIVITAIS